MPPEATPEDSRLVRLAARAMARHGLVHAYGHVSKRLDSAHFLVSPPQPLGTVLPCDECVVVPVDGDLPMRALPEVRMHRAIYRRRPEVGGIARVQPAALMALSALGRTPRALNGSGAYFAPEPPLWLGVTLVRDNTQAEAVAEQLGGASAIVLSGNGAVLAGQTIEEAATLAFYLEDAARIEIALLPATSAGARPREYSTAESAQRATRAGALFERMWQYLCFGDPEW